MATGPGVNQGKTSFVEEFLSGNPAASFATVNEGWTAAGNEGTVSESLVNKARSKLKLTRKRGTKGATSEANTGSVTQSKSRKGTKARAASKPEMAQSPADSRESGTGLSKSAFVSEMLGREPEANATAINKAWVAAGNEGTISDPLVYKIKRELDVTGRRSSGKSMSGGTSQPGTSEAGPIPGDTADAPKRSSQGEGSITRVGAGMDSIGGRERLVDKVEGGIDDLMYMLKANGGMPEVEAALRAVRRLLVRSHGE